MILPVIVFFEGRLQFHALDHLLQLPLIILQTVEIWTFVIALFSPFDRLRERKTAP